MARNVDSSRVEGKRLNRTFGGDAGIFLFLALSGAFSVLPMVYSIIQAFKPLDELFIYPPKFYVVRPTMENFVSLFQLVGNLWVPFSRYLFNTVFVTVAGTLGSVVIASLAAYPLAKHEFAGRKTINKIIQYALLFTSNATQIPAFIIMAKLGLVNTYLALLLPAWASTLGLFLMTSFMGQIPTERLEAAKIDGATELQTFWYIVLPSVRAAWLTLIIFSFQSLWSITGGNYIYDEQLKMLPTALSQIAAAGIARAGVGAATALFMMIPPILMFVIVQSSVIETMSHSGLKG
nr:carbohydrate ABC transporter permease [bacterium]